MEKRDAITYFAETDVRGVRRRFGIKIGDRTRHMYVIGKSGMGKSTLLAHMAVQDIEHGDGLIFFDPEGTVARTIFANLSERRKGGVTRISLTDGERVPSCNILAHVDRDKRNIIVAGILRACERNFGDVWDERLSLLLENALFALLEYKGATLLDVGHMLTNDEFRAAVAASITDTQTKMFWTVEFPRYTDHDTREAIGAITQKMAALFAHPAVRAMFGRSEPQLDIDRLVARAGVALIDLSAGVVSAETAAFVGALLMTKVHASMLMRSDMLPAVLAKAPHTFIYADGFPLYTRDTFGDLIADARRSKVGLVLAHQFLEEMPREVRDAIFSHVGTLVVFRVGSFDADIFEKEFAPHLTAEDIAGLGDAEMYVRLLIDGAGASPFWAVGLPPLSSAKAASGEPPKVEKKSDDKKASGDGRAVPREEARRQTPGESRTQEIPHAHAAGRSPEKPEEQRRQPEMPRREQFAILPHGAIVESDGDDGEYVSLADLLKKTREEDNEAADMTVTEGVSVSAQQHIAPSISTSLRAPVVSAPAPMPPPPPPKSRDDGKPTEIPEHVLKSMLE